MSTLPSSPASARPVVIWLWAGVWAALFSGVLLLTANTASDGCWFYRNHKSDVFAMTAILWLWLFVFFGLKNRGRVVLIACSLLVYFVAVPNVMRSRISAAEASTVGTLRTLMRLLQSYKDAHPQEGYPDALPDVQLPANVQRYFTFAYFASRSNPTGPANGFRVEAVPRQMRCGFQRSFTIFEDGTIHFTSDIRPAGKSDPPI